MQLPESQQSFAGYALTGVLGEGGFARVYDARSPTGARVAVKVLKPDAGDAYARSTRARFEREAHLLARLDSEFSVRLLDSGIAEGGLLYLVFEHVGGVDLSEYLAEKQRLPASEVEQILRPLLHALRDAHGHGVVHRDIKPANVRVWREAGKLRVKLLDFGIARATDHGHPSVTKTGELVGTPRYMSPEQLTGKPLGPTSDLYSLGMMVFELLQGSDALSGNTLMEQIERMQSGHRFAVDDMQPSAQKIVELIQRLTAREPSARMQSAAAALAFLDARADGHHAPATRSRGSRTKFAHWKLGVVVALSVVAIAAFALRNGTEPRRSPTTQRNTLVVSNEQPPVFTPKQRSDAGRSKDVGADLGDVAMPDSALLFRPLTPETSGCDRKEYGPHGLEKRDPGTWYYQPRRLKPGRPVPALVVLHTDFQHPRNLILSAGLDKLAEREQIVVIGPMSGESIGNKHLLAPAWDARGKGTGLVKRALQDTGKRVCLDHERIYVLSNGVGGRTAHFLACAPWVKGIATVGYFPQKVHAGPRSGDITCNHPRPTWMFAARHSKSEPIDGSRGCGRQGPRYSMTEVNQLLAKRNQCSPEPEVTNVKPGKCRTWAGCASPFESCIAPGGVPWKLGADFRAGFCLEPKAADFPVAERAWRFFQSLDESTAAAD